MESRIRLLGHPLRQILVPLPFGLLGLTTWMGGELVSRLGVGVSPHAHVNAPESMHS